MSKNIKNTCGETPEGYSSLNVDSDPNYIFQNDPAYSPVQLWDKDSNSVFVNSFVECKHYFEGGWSFNPAIFQEQNLQINTLILFSVSFLVIKILERFINAEK